VCLLSNNKFMLILSQCTPSSLPNWCLKCRKKKSLNFSPWDNIREIRDSRHVGMLMNIMDRSRMMKFPRVLPWNKKDLWMHGCSKKFWFLLLLSLVNCLNFMPIFSAVFSTLSCFISHNILAFTYSRHEINWR
jgi:hypothetical protein